MWRGERRGKAREKRGNAKHLLQRLDPDHQRLLELLERRRKLHCRAQSLRQRTASTRSKRSECEEGEKKRRTEEERRRGERKRRKEEEKLSFVSERPALQAARCKRSEQAEQLLRTRPRRPAQAGPRGRRCDRPPPGSACGRWLVRGAPAVRALQWHCNGTERVLEALNGTEVALRGH